MNFDEILSLVGGFGRFQKIMYVWISLPQIFLAFHMLVTVFTGAVPPHLCRSAWPSADTPTPLGYNFSLLLSSGGRPEVSCMAMVNHSALAPNHSHHPGSCQGGWEYSQETYRSTVVTEWDLVCDKASLNHIGSSIYMFGLLIGAVAFGALADKYGRRPVILFSLTIQAVFGVGAAFAPNYYIYILLRFVVGMSISGVIMNAFVLGTEWTGSKQRMLAGVITDYFFGFGYIMLAGVAYLIRDWRKLQLAISAPGFLFFFYIWFINILVYYGLSLNISDFGMNIYLTQMIFGLVEMPARTITLFTLNRSRKFSQLAFLAVAGIACLLTVFIPDDLSIIRTVLAMVGKFGVTASLSIVYVFSAELFPTVVRQNGIGLCSMCARVGGVLAPIIYLLRRVSEKAPMVLFGLGTILGSALTLLLPETANMHLPDTIADVERSKPSEEEEEERRAF